MRLTKLVMFAAFALTNVLGIGAANAQQKMYWTNRGQHKIQRANLDGSNIEDLVMTGDSEPLSIAIDLAAGKMYWTEYNDDRILRRIRCANLDGSQIQDLVTNMLRPQGIALDVPQGKMYWTEGPATLPVIRRANLDGSNIEDLVTANISAPDGLTLDLAAGKMYWTDWGLDNIQRANLDGTSVEEVVSTLRGPRDIVLDQGATRMYWTDRHTGKIQRAGLDGSNIEDLVTNLILPTGIALDLAARKMYWTEYGNFGRIRRANLNGSNVEELFPTGGAAGRPWDIALNLDCQPNGILDAIDIADGTSEDCNTSGVPDECEPNEDCNANGIQDICDIASGGSEDCTANAVPDECEPDCNNNENADSCDILAETSDDCNGTGIPDECQLYDNDCNGNGIPDECELDGNDCNGNGVPDDCDVAQSISEDCNDNGIPDECELDGNDCNVNIIPDECDIAGGNSLDHNGTGVPDECETVIFVDAEAIGLNDGTSWANAYSDLQDALAATPDPAVPFTLIWVAQGTYRPSARTDPADPRSATFQLASGVQLFGGFSGSETRLQQRIRATNVTILSGDLDGDDGPDFTNNGENSYHVVTAVGTDSTTILDGFTVIGGNANEFSEGKGGGMSIPDGDPIISHCRFTSNAALSGGGMFIGLASPIIESCVFTGNVAAGSGGGIYDRVGYTTPYLASLFNCVFSGNSAGGRGGGMNLHRANATLSNCVFFGNTAGDFGGGIIVVSNVFTATSCIFWGNSDGTGGGESAQIDTSRRPKYSLIQGWTAKLGDVGNIGDDPRFVDPDGPDDIIGTEDDDLRLLPDSPAINQGDTASVPEPRASDLDGHARVLCGRLDMGAFEFGIGDFNCDRTVDLTDFADWSACTTGPGNGRADSGCEAFDFEADADVDLKDFAGVQAVFGS